MPERCSRDSCKSGRPQSHRSLALPLARAEETRRKRKRNCTWRQVLSLDGIEDHQISPSKSSLYPFPYGTNGRIITYPGCLTGINPESFQPSVSSMGDAQSGQIPTDPIGPESERSLMDHAQTHTVSPDPVSLKVETGSPISDSNVRATESRDAEPISTHLVQIVEIWLFNVKKGFYCLLEGYIGALSIPAHHATDASRKCVARAYCARPSMWTIPEISIDVSRLDLS
jgi:hypothetical protein